MTSALNTRSAPCRSREGKLCAEDTGHSGTSAGGHRLMLVVRRRSGRPHPERTPPMTIAPEHRRADVRRLPPAGVRSLPRHPQGHPCRAVRRRRARPARSTGRDRGLGPRSPSRCARRRGCWRVHAQPEDDGHRTGGSELHLPRLADGSPAVRRARPGGIAAIRDIDSDRRRRGRRGEPTTGASCTGPTWTSPRSRSSYLEHQEPGGAGRDARRSSRRSGSLGVPLPSTERSWPPSRRS